MGCDIHATIEKKPFDEDYWWAVANDVEIDRNYWLFGLLAGVRGSCEPIIEARGIPQNKSYDFASFFEEWQEDAHSASYLTLKEIKDYLASERYERDRKDGDFIHAPIEEQEFYQFMEIVAKKVGGDDKVRLCFFFDN